MDERTLDPGALGRLRRIGGGELVVEMIGLFLENTPQRLETARDAHGRGDRGTLHRAVHSIKSTAATLGGRALEAVAATAEVRAREDDLGAVRPLLDVLDREYEALREQLEAERDRLGRGLMEERT